MTPITNPTPQHALRGHRPTRPGGRVANSPALQARLAARLTPRDRWLLRMLHEHRVLTSTQIRQLAFPSARAANQRLLELHRWRVIDRFQPFVTRGSAPMHYVLDTAGATTLAAEHGIEPTDLGYRHDRAIGIAHSLQLAHNVGVNDWFTALVAHARHTPDTTLTAWWSETRCHRHFGDLVRPDGYGRWRDHDMAVEFFLEYDLGTEPTRTVAAKLHDYAALAAATGITTPVLIWLTTARREVTVRTALKNAWQNLDTPDAVPIATAAADLLSEAAPPSPAAPVWLPLDTSDQCRLAELAAAWPSLDQTTPPTAPNPDMTHAVTTGRAALPAPKPMPPEPPWR